MDERNRRRLTRYRLIGAVAAVFAIALTLTTVSSAQIPVFPTPTPRPRPPTPEPTPSTPPTAEPTETPAPSDLPIPTDSATPIPEEVLTPPPSTTASPGDAAYDKLPPSLEQKFTLEVPIIARTRPRNTSRLVDLLEPLTEYGLPLDQVLVDGMGRFPVAARAWYFDDWLNPRYTPVPHLHKGLDIFADFGTPIRAPDAGVITRLTNNPQSGGIGVWMRGSDRTEYYFAHLLERAVGLRTGQSVEVGTVVGFVGDTGNARGGTPHLHFEIHRGGPIPPKPSVDRWLDEAIELAPRWVEARREEIQSKRGLLGWEDAARRTRADLEASMLLTLLDPVGGAVGLLPRLQLAPTHTSRVSEGLLIELIRLRLDGFLLVPSAHGLHLRD